MVALKDKRKWTRTEYKGEHKRSSRDMNYNSFHDASTDLRYHSLPSTLSPSIVVSGVFLCRLPDCCTTQDMHQSCKKTLCNLMYSMSIHSFSPLNMLHISVSALPISVVQCFGKRVSLCLLVCLSVYYCCLLSPSLMIYLRSDYVCWASHVWLKEGKRRDCDQLLLFLTEQHTNTCCWSGLTVPCITILSI